jgi:hypothetical protein
VLMSVAGTCEAPLDRMSFVTGVITGLGEERVAYTSRDDVAAAAAGILLRQGHAGAISNATGPVAVTGAGRAALLLLTMWHAIKKRSQMATLTIRNIDAEDGSRSAVDPERSRGGRSRAAGAEPGRGDPPALCAARRVDLELPCAKAGGIRRWPQRQCSPRILPAVFCRSKRERSRAILGSCSHAGRPANRWRLNALIAATAPATGARHRDGRYCLVCRLRPFGDRSV